MNSVTERFVQIRSAHQCLALVPTEGLPPFNAQLLQRHRPDAHWAVVDAGHVTARCSLWWQSTPHWPPHRVGLIGHYAASSDDTASDLLELACQQLAENDCTLAVGPMDGNTWRDYRFVTESGNEPGFFLEPHNPPEWPAQFHRHGFREFARYFSAVADDLTRTSPRMDRVRMRMTKQGVRIRSVSEDHFDEDLRQIHAVAQTVFRDHVLYQAMGEAEFVQQYETLRSNVPFDLVLLAEQNGRMVGFGFATPDMLQAERGETVDTVLIKTLGVLPDREFAGLGQLLLEQLQQRAATLGFRRAIHALVRETGNLQKISQRYAVPFRRYTLFAKELGS